MAKKLLNFRVDEALYDAVAEAAKQRGEPVSAVVVQALHEHLAVSYSSGPLPPARKDKLDDCPHPRQRVIKGLCYACGRAVG